MEETRTERQKQYTALWRSKPENKDKEREHSGKYREANFERTKGKIECERCGAMISRNGIAGHKRTKKCVESAKPQNT